MGRRTRATGSHVRSGTETNVTLTPQTCAKVSSATMRQAKPQLLPAELAMVPKNGRIEGMAYRARRIEIGRRQLDGEKEAKMTQPKGGKTILAGGLCALTLLATPQNVVADEGGLGGP
jgi:hypothetical protein